MWKRSAPDVLLMFATQWRRAAVPACRAILWVTPVTDLTCRLVLQQWRLVVDRQQLVGIARKNLQDHNRHNKHVFWTWRSICTGKTLYHEVTVWLPASIQPHSCLYTLSVTIRPVSDSPTIFSLASKSRSLFSLSEKNESDLLLGVPPPKKNLQ